MAERDAASRGFANARKHSGGFGTRPSATTSGRDKRVHARLRRAMELADGEADFCFIPRRTGAINPAVERREANVPRYGT